MSSSFHTSSFLLGVFTLGACLFLGSAGGADGHVSPTVVLQTGPQPKDHVRIHQGVPYQVPAGKVLTLKGFTHSTLSTNSVTGIEVDGQRIGRLVGYGSPGESSGVEEIPFGITVFEGETVTAIDIGAPATSPSMIVLLGHLSNA